MKNEEPSQKIQASVAWKNKPHMTNRSGLKLFCPYLDVSRTAMVIPRQNPPLAASEVGMCQERIAVVLQWWNRLLPAAEIGRYQEGDSNGFLMAELTLGHGSKQGSVRSNFYFAASKKKLAVF